MASDHVHERGPQTRTKGRYKCQHCERVRDLNDWIVCEEVVATIIAHGLPDHQARLEFALDTIVDQENSTPYKVLDATFRRYFAWQKEESND